MLSYLKTNKLFYHFENMAKRQPITADIDIVNFCNQNCFYCYYQRGKGYMPVSMFEHVLDVITQHGVKSVNLTGTGEPLIHPEIEGICEALNTRGVQYGIKTNLTKLPPANSQAVWVKVSLDAADAEEYRMIRGTDDFDLVIENLQQVKAGLQCMVTTISNMVNFFNFYRKFDSSYMVFRPIAKEGESYYPAGMRRDIIEKIRDLRALDRRVIDNTDKWQFNGMPTPCPMNWVTLYINWKGQVVYCCDKQQEVVGSVENFWLKERWQTDPETCHVPCRLYYYNQLHEQMEKDRDGHTDFV